jgi:hypothetical protein
MENVAKIESKGKALPIRGLEVRGKVLRVRRHEAFTYTSIVCPAADEYSKPQVVEIRSKSRFAEKDEVANARVVLGGYEGKAYQVVDRDTGERRSIIPVTHYLDLVEE